MTVFQMKQNHRRIPRETSKIPKAETEGSKITDLTTKTIPDLLELRDRQIKLLKNKSFLMKLPDKGAKIQNFYEKIVLELKSRHEEEKTCELLEKLNLSGNKIQDLEWRSKIETTVDTYLDSDDDSDPEDVLHLLSQNTHIGKTVKHLQPDKSLITSEDLVNIDEVPHVKYIVEKTQSEQKPKIGGQFKPYKTTVSDVHNPEKEILRKRHKKWEVTAATPPPILHGPAKILSLEESLKLQKDYNQHLKQIEVQHATEKLMSRIGAKTSELPEDLTRFSKYREVESEQSEESDIEGSDKEVHDEEPERGGVVFTVMK